MPVAAMPDRAHQLYTAATDLFIERGYRAVDVADIVARTGVSHGTFYNYFHSKRDLLEAILTTTEREIAYALTGASPQVATRDQYVAEFAAKIRRTLEYVVANAKLMSFTVLTAAGVDDDAFNRALDGYENLSRQVAAFLSMGMDRAWIRNDLDLDVAGQAVVSCVATALVPVLLGDPDTFDVADTAEACSGYLLRGIRSAPSD
jgi:AcrR family transcriptional regulator